VLALELADGAGRPCCGRAAHEIVHRVLTTGEAGSPRSLNPAVPRRSGNLCLKCLEKSAPRLAPHGWRGELSRFLRGDSIQARPIGPARSLLALVPAAFEAGGFSRDRSSF